jgi:hypothetical protein
MRGGVGQGHLCIDGCLFLSTCGRAIAHGSKGTSSASHQVALSTFPGGEGTKQVNQYRRRFSFGEAGARNARLMRSLAP